MTVQELSKKWYEQFNVYATDLYPGRYTPQFCQELAEQAFEVRALAKEKGSFIVAHNYQYPELQEVADMVGDSLGLALEVKKQQAKRVDFSSVHFMGATAKILLGDATRVFVQGDPSVHGCSLVFGTNHRVIELWKKRHPDGVCVTYVNSDVRTKAMSEYISTSRNTHQVIARAAREHTGQILVLPDKFLGAVMKAKAVSELGVDPERIEIYTTPFQRFHASCYVHEKIGDEAPDRALEEHEGAELLLHPECGCASSCLYKLSQGKLPADRVFYLSTEAMLERARMSSAPSFVVGTESGMIYRLRKELPDKIFHPISTQAVCGYMKQNTMERLIHSLRHDEFEIVIDDEADPNLEVIEGRVIRINRALAQKAKAGVERMIDTK